MVGSPDGRMVVAMTGHGSIPAVRSLPVRCDGRLRICKADLTRANEALELHLDAIFAPCFGPGLELQVIERAWVTSKCQRHNVVELILAGS
jgi:hypothetical protein